MEPMPTIRIRSKVHRMVSSIFPPIDLFEWAETKEEAMMLAEIEGLTNDRLLLERAGNFSAIPESEWVGGPGSTVVMAPFAHIGASRFSDSTNGCYYASKNVKTAIAETKFHKELFFKGSDTEPCKVEYREYIGKILQPMHDITDVKLFGDVLDPNIETYPVSQAFANNLRAAGAWGVYYPSLRDEGGFNVAAFRPKAVEIPVQGSHYCYIWNGEEINEVYKLSKV